MDAQLRNGRMKVSTCLRRSMPAPPRGRRLVSLPEVLREFGHVAAQMQRISDLRDVLRLINGRHASTPETEQPKLEVPTETHRDVLHDQVEVDGAAGLPLKRHEPFEPRPDLAQALAQVLQMPSDLGPREELSAGENYVQGRHLLLRVYLDQLGGLPGTRGPAIRTLVRALTAQTMSLAGLFGDRKPRRWR
jgi:hypothetical protein